MKTVIVLVMHGALPNDFPRRELVEFFSLRNQLGNASQAKKSELQKRFRELENKVRQWPRTSQNDPYCVGAQELGAQLSRVTKEKVIVCFNEFCTPSLEEALEKAAQEAESVIVITPMMTRGGEHAEVEIPAAIKKIQKKYPEISFRYAWPFETAQIAQFLASQINHYLLKED
jgi:sirohydrochlorin ferrochelatase